MVFDLRKLLEERGDEGYALHSRYVNPQFARVLRTIGFDRRYVSADGSWLTDANGDRYLDFLSGFGVHALGRAHPVVRQALRDVMDVGLPEYVQFDTPALSGLLAEALVSRAPTPLERVYFCNSGGEAVEAALKYARYATGRSRVLYCDHAYHGLTAGALSVNGAAEYRDGFGTLLPGARIPFGDLDALAREIEAGDVAALVVEPVQGKGVYVAPPGWLAAAADLLHRDGALLIADEVQCGIGRSGTFFAYEQENVEPDLVTVAKALSGGYVPVGAVLAKAAVWDRVYSSMDRAVVHASTFSGGGLAMAAGLATLSVIEDEDLVANAARSGDRLRTELTAMAERYELIGAVRGRGLMIGIEFAAPTSKRLKVGWSMMEKARSGLFTQLVVVPLFQKHHVLTQVAGDHMNVLKLLPPLIAGDAEVDHFLRSFEQVMEQAHKGSGIAWDIGRKLAVSALRR